MLNTYLKAKVRAIKITDRKIEYEGSLTLDRNIMDQLGVAPYEQVFINSKYNKSRIMTYVLPGKRGSNCCELNGGAVHHFHNGEIIHLLFFTQSEKPVKPVVL
jgi:aspartate 1-decarboxylase